MCFGCSIVMVLVVLVMINIGRVENIIRGNLLN